MTGPSISTYRHNRESVSFFWQPYVAKTFKQARVVWGMRNDPFH